MEQGERWTKETVAQCIVAAALIATVTFAAGFTLPGGNNPDTGYPTLMKKSAFGVFLVTDTISLYTSSASILIFLSILIQRYTEMDFLVYLPSKLMVGLCAMYISIATMMIAFSASFAVLYAKNMNWISTLVGALGMLPVLLCFRLEYRLLFDIINSTFSSRYLFRPKNRPLY